MFVAQFMSFKDEPSSPESHSGVVLIPVISSFLYCCFSLPLNPFYLFSSCEGLMLMWLCNFSFTSVKTPLETSLAGGGCRFAALQLFSGPASFKMT